MFERKLTYSLGKISKRTLREFKGVSRMTVEQYLNAVDEYNRKVDELHLEERKQRERERKRRSRENAKLTRYDNKKMFDLKITRRPENKSGWFDNEIKPQLVAACKKMVGKTMVYAQSSVDGALFKSGMIDIAYKNAENIYWHQLFSYIQTYRDGEVFNIFEQFENYARIVIFDTAEVLPEKISQKYLDGAKHCVIEPLRRVFTEYANNSNSDASRKKMMQTVRRLNELEIKYANGVPEEDMDIVAKAVNRCIVIHDIIGNEIKKYNTKSSKYFHFTNTRKNHVDEGFITLKGDYIGVSQSEMNNIIDKHDNEKLFYIFDGDVDTKCARALSSSLGNWRVLNEESEYYKEFDKHTGRKHYGIDAVKYSDLNEFIKEGRIVNATPVPLCENPNDLTHYTHHIDIQKAYTQHKQCEFYQGFLGHIHGYAKMNLTKNIEIIDFLTEHIGVYHMKVIQCKNKLLNQLGIFEKHTYTLPSCEILAFIKKYGVVAHIVAGCWGSSIDFDYTEDMLENRRYAIWAGKLGMDCTYHRYSFIGDREWAAHLANELGIKNVFYFDEMKMITVKIDKSKYYTYHHIFAFITSYTRLNMLDIMSKIDGQLVKVIMDGIYFRGEVPDDITIPHHTDKELKRHIGFREHWYYQTGVDTSSWEQYNDKFVNNCILAGAGGTGKTYSVFNNKTLISPLYVVPSHLLGKKMRDTYGCEYTTMHRLIGDECISYKEMFHAPHTILIDELTMIDKKMINKALQMYPTTLFLIAGDIDKKQWFQCRNGTEGKMTELFMPQNWKYIMYEIDHRSKDDQIKQMKALLRDKMREVFENGGKIEAEILNDYIKQTYKTTSYVDAIKQFKTGDIWIAGTHATNNRLLNDGIVSGYINAKKEINKTEGEKRGAFTIHSYQGLTIEKERVFISLDNFEYAMLYTAISRCCNFNQITFVY